MPAAFPGTGTSPDLSGDRRGDRRGQPANGWPPIFSPPTSPPWRWRSAYTALEKASRGGDVGQLLVYESANSTSQGRAAIGVGDIATADNVAVFAPGVSSAPVTMAQGIDQRGSHQGRVAAPVAR